MKKLFTSPCLFVVNLIWIFAFITAPVYGQGMKRTVVGKADLPSYIPPSCVGKTITRMTKEEMMTRDFTDVKPNPKITKSDQLKVFDSLTKVLDSFYLYPDYRGLNWRDTVAKYRSKIEGGLNTENFYTEMERYIWSLGDRHSSFQSPVRFRSAMVQQLGQTSLVGIGIYNQINWDKMYYSVLSIYPNSPAYHAGLKQHDVITSVDGLSIVMDSIYYPLLRGPECTMATLTVKSPGKVPRVIKIIRARVTGPAPVYARLIPTTDGRRIGYIFLPTFTDGTIPAQVKKALEDFGPLDGLVLDNRMNGGGLGAVLLLMLDYFSDGILGHFVSRTARRPLEIFANPVHNSQKVPLVILVSKKTVSYGEVFAGVLQDIGRAKLVGQTTAGRVETLFPYFFIDSARVYIAKESFDPIRSNTNWQGIGVKPDVEAHADWDEFTFENDPALAAALKIIPKK